MLVKDAVYWQARLLVTWRKLAAVETGLLLMDDDEVTQLGADLEVIEAQLKRLTSPEKRLANVAKLQAWKSAG